MASDRARREYQAFLEADRKEQEAIAAKIEAPFKRRAAEERLNRAAQRLRNAKRFALLEDQLNLYVPDYMFAKRFASDAELEAFNRAEARAFYTATPEWQRLAVVSENIETLQSVFAKRGLTVVARESWAWAFRTLLKVGLLLEPSDIELETPARAPVVSPIPGPTEESFDNIPRLPLGHQAPAAYRREAEQTYTGIDSFTGRERDYTQIEVDRMDSETYRKTFIKGDLPHLTRVNFGKR